MPQHEPKRSAFCRLADARLVVSKYALAALAPLTTSLSAAGTYDLRICCNGVLSGLVIVTSMCGFIDPWAAVVCGFIAGATYPCMSFLLVRRLVDLQAPPSSSTLQALRLIIS